MRLIILIMGNSICSVTNSEEVACEGEVSKKPVHSDDRKASSEKTDVNGPGTSCFFVGYLSTSFIGCTVNYSYFRKHILLSFKVFIHSTQI
jgi:hypothetical protein